MFYWWGKEGKLKLGKLEWEIREDLARAGERGFYRFLEEQAEETVFGIQFSGLTGHFSCLNHFVEALWSYIGTVRPRNRSAFGGDFSKKLFVGERTKYRAIGEVRCQIHFSLFASSESKPQAQTANGLNTNNFRNFCHNWNLSLAEGFFQAGCPRARAASHAPARKGKGGRAYKI